MAKMSTASKQKVRIADRQLDSKHASSCTQIWIICQVKPQTMHHKITNQHWNETRYWCTTQECNWCKYRERDWIIE